MHENDRRPARAGQVVVNAHAVGVRKRHARPLLVSANEMIERVESATVDEDVERGNSPHERIFETELIPKIFADTPTLQIGDEQKGQYDGGYGACKEPEGEQGAADKLRD